MTEKLPRVSAADAVRVAGAGPFRYALTGLDIPYNALAAGGLIMALVIPMLSIV